MLHRLLLVAGSWEVTVIKHVWACPGFLAVAAAGEVCLQQGETNNRWWLVAVPSFLLTSKVTGAAGGVCS